MKKDFGAQTWLYPMPVLIVAAYGDDGTPNAMNAAWGGVCDYGRVAVCLDDEHKTTKNLLARRAFTVAVADAAHLVEADYLGIVSGNDVPNKLEVAGLTCTKAAHVDAPVIDQFPMALECELVSHDEESGVVVGQVVNVCVEETCLNEAGKPDPAKLRPITFDPANAAYWTLGERAGGAFADGQKLVE